VSFLTSGIAPRITSSKHKLTGRLSAQLQERFSFLATSSLSSLFFHLDSTRRHFVASDRITSFPPAISRLFAA
jgi:hypothetical protein